MEPEVFLNWVVPKARELQAQYHLQGWRITIRVAPEGELAPEHAADVFIQEAYRQATITVSETLVRYGDRALLLKVIEHELQHVFLHPMDALKNLVMDAIPDALKEVINNEFMRTNERIRASLESILNSTGKPDDIALVAVEQ